MKYKNIKIILISSLLSIIFFSVGIFSINKINNMSVFYQTAQAENALKEIPQLENKITTIPFVGEVEEKYEGENTLCLKSTEDCDNLLLSLLDLGQEVELPDINYIPKKLKELDIESSTRKGIYLTEEAMTSFESMVKDAKEAGYTIRATSGFRSYETQKKLFENALKKDEAGARVSIAKPGYSEHQLGTAIDITGSTINYSSATSTFNETPEDLWLRQDAYLYGFIQSYPQNKEDITGYKYEPWHYRYVGIDNAKKIKDDGLTITEFLKP